MTAPSDNRSPMAGGTQLAACPFCGGTPRLLRLVEAYPASGGHPAGEYDAWFNVTCDNCGIEQGDEYRSSAIAAWNRRALPTPPRGMSDSQIYAIADEHGMRYRTSDEEGMQFDKHAVLDFARAVLAASAPKEQAEGDRRAEVLASRDFNDAKATILSLPEDDVRSLAITQFIQLQLHEKYAAPAAAPKQAQEPSHEAAPPNGLPTWDECATRVENSDFIAKRIAEGGYGAEPDSLLATELHRFIYEYDDADPYRSAWFLHRLERLLNETRAASPSAPQTGDTKDGDGVAAVDPVRAALQEMVDMMDNGDEHGAGSPWHRRATEALAGVPAAPALNPDNWPFASLADAEDAHGVDAPGVKEPDLTQVLREYVEAHDAWDPASNLHGRTLDQIAKETRLRAARQRAHEVIAGVTPCPARGAPEQGIELRCCLPQGHAGLHSFVINPAGVEVPRG